MKASLLNKVRLSGARSSDYDKVCYVVDTAEQNDQKEVLIRLKCCRSASIGPSLFQSELNCSVMVICKSVGPGSQAMLR